MKATELADFFDFTIRLNVDNELDEYGKDDDEPTKYVVEDNQWCFASRYIDDVSELTECFDSMLDDYIIRDLEEEFGFEYDYKTDERTIMEAAADFATEHDISYAEFVRAMAGYDEIEDDVA